MTETLEGMTEKEITRKLQALSAYNNLDDLLAYSNWKFRSHLLNYLMDYLRDKKYQHDFHKYISIGVGGTDSIAVYLRSEYCKFSGYLEPYRFITIQVDSCKSVMVTFHKIIPNGVNISNPRTELIIDRDKLHDIYGNKNLKTINPVDLVESMADTIIDEFNKIIDESIDSLIYNITANK